MAKFRVGDEVKLGGGCARVIHIESTGDFPYLVERADNRIEFCNDAEMMLIAPAIPDGWTPADEPPDGIRDVLVMLKGGEKRLGWYSESAIISGGNWYLYPEGTTPKSIDDDDTSFDDTPAAPGEVLAWREIEPAAKARYVVCAIHTEHDTLEEAELHALRAMESLRVNVVIACVVAKVKPGNPVITKLEE
jgi:hypothetical protein